jgi:hypothetical protein
VPAILLMIVGSITMTLQADRTSDNYTLDELIALVLSLKSIIYCSFLVFFMILAAASYVLVLESLR